MRIIIPTHGRVHKQTTLANLPEDIRREVLLVASDQASADELKKLYKVATKVAPVNSIADKRQWILENVKSDVFMLDDDMAFYQRCAPKHRTYAQRWKAAPGHKVLSLDTVTPAAVTALFTRLRENLGAAATLVGIGSRFGNDTEASEFRLGASRLMHAFGYCRKQLPKSFKFNAVQFREDFHLALSVYRAGRQSYQVYDWCVAPGSYGAPGGCSSERTTAASDAAALKLAELHPGFVKVVDKSYKGHPRKEVVVQWKKALISGSPKCS